MSRKLQKSIWREGHRRSPRISQKIMTDATATAGNTGTRGRALPATAQKMGNGQGPAFQTRARKKRKLRPVQEFAATTLSNRPQKGGRKHKDDDQNIKSDQPLVGAREVSTRRENQATKTSPLFRVPSAPSMPEKRVLELILDVLQRRDTHEIFAEPVDPNEVEDYYQIIEEPMDFGTMRAKLHEGLYQSLEQFENNSEASQMIECEEDNIFGFRDHDLFLIPKNAMHFNSSATIYFRQARAIYELAQKIFHVLKSDPENFELEFSKTRRKRRRRSISSRSHRDEAKGSIKSSCPKLPTNEKSSGMPACGNSLNHRRTFQLSSQFSGIATSNDAIDREVLSGAEDDRRFISFAVDRRCTYSTWASFLNENESTFSIIYGTPKPLEHVNQQDIGYRESLTLFVKDLGPIAQMIAEQKLLGLSAEASKYQTSNYWFQAQNCPTDMESDPANLGPSTFNTIITPLESQNLQDHHCWQTSIIRNSFDRMNNLGNKLGVPGDTLEVTPNSNLKNAFGALNGEVHASDEEKTPGVFGNDESNEDWSYEVQLGSYSFTARTRDSDLVLAELQNAGRKPTTLEQNKGNLEHQAQLESPSDTKVSDSLSKNSLSYPTSWSLRNTGKNLLSTFSQAEGFMHKSGLDYLGGHDQVIAAGVLSHGGCISSEAGQTSRSDQLMPEASQFTFDLPFLRTRLDQMSCLGPDRSSQLHPYSEGPSFAQISYQKAST